MPRRREVSVDYTAELARITPLGLGAGRHEGDYGVLQCCAPFEEPQASQDSLLELREVLADALDALPPQQRRTCEALWIERLSERATASALGVCQRTVGRERDRAIQKLRAALETNALIKERLQ